jgi:hypothetical protein
MPAITVTAVDTANEKLTATAHGLLTGDRFRLRNVGGALPAATPSLAMATDYFAILVDANNIKVATSSANAFAGTAVDLTGSGSGTTTIEYGLPYCIPTALAAAGTQIKSANDNGAWNALVALYCWLTGQTQSVFAGIQQRAVAVEATLTPIVQYQDWSSRIRSTVDHLGFRQGQVTEFEEFWRTTGTTMPVGWTATLATSGAATITDPASTFPQRHNALSVIGSAGSSVILTHEFLGFLDDNRVVTFEQTVLVPNIPAAGVRANTLEIGFQFSHSGANDYYVIFRVNTSSANWRALTIGSSTNDDDTSYAINLNAIARLKIEIAGSGLTGQSAGTFTARFFVDGVLRTTRTFTTPGADKFRPYAKHSTTGAAIGTGSFLLGRPRICFNHVTAGDSW